MIKCRMCFQDYPLDFALHFIFCNRVILSVSPMEGFSDLVSNRLISRGNDSFNFFP